MQALLEKLQRVPFVRYFVRKDFFHYTWIGAVVSFLSVFLIWLFIDVFHISTVIASTIAVVVVFLVRYILLRIAKFWEK